MAPVMAGQEQAGPRAVPHLRDAWPVAPWGRRVLEGTGAWPAAGGPGGRAFPTCGAADPRVRPEQDVRALLRSSRK